MCFKIARDCVFTWQIFKYFVCVGSVFVTLLDKMRLLLTSIILGGERDTNTLVSFSLVSRCGPVAVLSLRHLVLPRRVLRGRQEGRFHVSRGSRGRAGGRSCYCCRVQCPVRPSSPFGVLGDNRALCGFVLKWLNLLHTAVGASRALFAALFPNHSDFTEPGGAL